MAQIPIGGQDQTAPDVRRYLVEGYSDLHSVSGLEHCPNEQGGKALVKPVPARRAIIC